MWEAHTLRLNPRCECRVGSDLRIRVGKSAVTELYCVWPSQSISPSHQLSLFLLTLVRSLQAHNAYIYENDCLLVACPDFFSLLSKSCSSLFFTPYPLMSSLSFVLNFVFSLQQVCVHFWNASRRSFIRGNMQEVTLSRVMSVSTVTPGRCNRCITKHSTCPSQNNGLHFPQVS